MHMSYQLLSFLCGAFMVHAAHKDRPEQLGRMEQYELIHLNLHTVDDDTKSFEFDAFDQHYVVELSRKPLSAPSYVLHSNVDTADHLPFSSNTNSCHFSGRVTNTDKSVVSVSLCDGRGVRGRIAAFGETLLMKPSAYYMDLAADKLANHALDDELLVYRRSDFVTPDIMDNGELTISDGDDVGQFMERRRLYASYDAQTPAETEMAVIIGPVRVANYKEDYGNNWYSQLYQDTADLVSSVDEIYSNTDWNANGRNSIGGKGSVRIVFSEIYIVHEFTGIHYSLRPTKKDSDACGLDADEFSDYKWCYVDGQKWLTTVQRWVSSNFDTSSYDNVQFITDIRFDWTGYWYGTGTLGWGLERTMCHGAPSLGLDTYGSGYGGEDNLVHTVAHELGHNFGMAHDGQTGSASACGASDGIMGYGPYGSHDDEFSSCSLDGMKNYFNGWGNGLRCLSTGWDSATDEVESNVDENGGRLEDCGGIDCVYISGFPDIYQEHEGYYKPTYYGGCHGDHTFYKGPNDEYLCYDSDISRWLISTELCTNPFAMSSRTGGDALSVRGWGGLVDAVDRILFAPMVDLQVSDCNGNQAFSADLECLDDNSMDDVICISTEDSLWDGERTFMVLDDVCLNDKPVYHFLVRNDSEFIEYDNFTWEEVDEMSYYVHFELVYLDVTGNETVGQWMLSQNEISTNYLAYCQEEELADCTAGSWTVQTVFLPEFDSDDTEVIGDGYITDVLNAFMTVRDGNCDASYVSEESAVNGYEKRVVMILLIVLAVLTMICVTPFLERKCVSLCRGDGKHSIPDSEEPDMVHYVSEEPDNLDMTIEVEAQVTMSTTRD